MNREILFRGKHVDNGDWVIGDGIHCPKSQNWKGTCWIDGMQKRANDWVQVVPETVGQYTGLTDKNGTKIFEWDVVKATDRFNKSIYYFVEFKSGAFMLKQKGVEYHIYFNDLPEKYYCIEVIGNIHDNQELLEGSKYVYSTDA
jgi:uncharacterized phage protein (TIGR01671 family)